MTLKITATDSIDSIIDRIENTRELLTNELPDTETTARLIRSILSDRKRCPVRKVRVTTTLRSPRKTASEDERAFHSLVHWHSGKTGGSLWGPMIARMRFDSTADYDRADTLAMLFNAMTTGNPSKAGDIWRHALTGR